MLNYNILFYCVFLLGLINKSKEKHPCPLKQDWAPAAPDLLLVQTQLRITFPWCKGRYQVYDHKRDLRGFLSLGNLCRDTHVGGPDLAHLIWWYKYLSTEPDTIDIKMKDYLIKYPSVWFRSNCITYPIECWAIQVKRYRYRFSDETA